MPPRQRLLLWVMLAAIALPVPLSLLGNALPRPLHPYILSPRLRDNAERPRLPRLSLTAWRQGSFPRNFEAWFVSRLEPRGWIVRLTNQLYYSTFGKSYMRDRQIIVGRDRYLYELAYLTAYCQGADPDATAAFAPLVTELGAVRAKLA